MTDYRIDPEVIGEIYFYDESDSLVLEVMHWFGDDIVELYGFFLVTEKLMKDLISHQIGGIKEYKQVKIKKWVDSAIKIEKKLYLMTLSSNKNDIYSVKSRLYVSKNALSIIRNHQHNTLEIKDIDSPIKSPWEK